MATLPLTFQSPPPPAVASFEWDDVASGLAYSIFYACVDWNSVYLLVDTADLYSDVISEGVNNTTKDLTFNTSVFNLPRTVKGTAYISVPIENGAGVTSYIAGTVYHYDGTTATSLGTATNQTDGVGDNEWKQVMLQFTLTEKRFKKGDLLRVKITFVTSGGNGIISYDPKNRTSGNVDSSQLTVHIPFKITD